MALIDLVDNLNVISIVGLAKNTGKTVTVNTLISEFKERKRNFGITSIGRDGESYDVINNLIVKPRVHLHKGVYVATTDKLFQSAEAKVEILKETSFQTALGRVLIGKVIEEGYVEIAGPSSANSVKYVCELIKEMGNCPVFVDGAIDRKTFSSPQYSDGCIVTTGAVLSTQLSEVIKETDTLLNQMQLPELEDSDSTNKLKKEDGLILVDRQKKFKKLPVKSLLGDNKLVLQNINEDVEYLYFDKLIPESFLKDLLNLGRDNKLTIVSLSSTMLFIPHGMMKLYNRKNIYFRTLFPHNIAAITVNPVAPLSHQFNSSEFVNELKEKMNGIPVFDVKHQSYN